MVIVNVVGVDVDVLVADASHPGSNKTVAPLGVLPIVTSNGVPTAALVGAEVTDNVLRAKAAVTGRRP